MRDGLGILASAAESEALASSVSNTGDVYFVPALTGLGTPYWDPYARGTIVGISRGTTRAHIVRATLEAMAFQTVDVLEAMKKDAALSIPALRVDGGACANNLLLSLQSDLSGLPILRPACSESTALGAANLAGLSTGVYDSLADIKACRGEGTLFHPSISNEERAARLTRWHEAIERAKAWVS